MESMYPDNIVGWMFRILESMMSVCNFFVENFFKTPITILTEWLDDTLLPDWLVEFIGKVMAWHSPLFNNVSLFDLLVGTALSLILVAAIVKFATDIIGL